ncbi:MAG: CDP-alcohol phosphatidyltransferase family protein [Methanobacteriaceae archaeon]
MNHDKLKNVGITSFLKIPDLLSILNAVFGFLSITMVIDSNFILAAMFMIVALIFDSVDGWVARKTGRDDSLGFGKNIDSLSDIISFGIAPAVLLYGLGEYYIGHMLFDPTQSFLGISAQLLIPILAILTYIVPIMIVVCGLLRLTRFNVICDKICEDKNGTPYGENIFIGMPIPTTAIILSSFYLSGIFNIWVCMVIMAIVSLLMISSFRYPKFTNLKLISILFGLILLMFIWTSGIFSQITTSTPLESINIGALLLFIMSLIFIIYPAISKNKN